MTTAMLHEFVSLVSIQFFFLYNGESLSENIFDVFVFCISAVGRSIILSKFLLLCVLCSFFVNHAPEVTGNAWNVKKLPWKLAQYISFTRYCQISDYFCCCYYSQIVRDAFETISSHHHRQKGITDIRFAPVVFSMRCCQLFAMCLVYWVYLCI